MVTHRWRSEVIPLIPSNLRRDFSSLCYVHRACWPWSFHIILPSLPPILERVLGVQMYTTISGMSRALGIQTGVVGLCGKHFHLLSLLPGPSLVILNDTFSSVAKNMFLMHELCFNPREQNLPTMLPASISCCWSLSLSSLPHLHTLWWAVQVPSDGAVDSSASGPYQSA